MPGSIACRAAGRQLREGTAYGRAILQRKQADGSGRIAYGGTLAEGTFDRKDVYDAMELGINQYLLEKKKSIGPLVGAASAKRSLKAIEQEILQRIPTQTVRSAEADEFQQFSTPPHLAYVANWLANITHHDVVLEPSAGSGGLVVKGKG